MSSLLLQSHTLTLCCLPPLFLPCPPPNTHTQAANDRAIRNKAKIAASTKRPRYPVYEEGGRIVWIKPGQEHLVFGAEGEQAAAAAQQQQPAELKITVTEA